MYLEESPVKGITVANLREVLQTLPPDWILTANLVHNLAVYDAGLQQRGYIDLGTEQYEAFDEEARP